MWLIFGLFAFLVGGGWLVGKMIGSLFSDKESYTPTFKRSKPDVYITNNYTTNVQNNLNITQEQLEELKN